MVQWMLAPANWTLPAGGAVVGYITNWIALKVSHTTSCLPIVPPHRPP